VVTGILQMPTDMPTNTGRNISIIGAILEHDQNRCRALIERLSTLCSVNITTEDLRDYALENREYLLFDALCDLNVLTITDPKVSSSVGRLNPARLPWLHEHLAVFIEAHNASIAAPSTDHSDQFLELAWTLPAELISLADEDPMPKSLVALMRYVISRSQYHLIMLSPFLDKGGAELLVGSLQGAFRRGIETTLISHGLENPPAKIAEALDVYKNAAPNIQIYSASPVHSGHEYLLLHAKLVVADDQFAVLSSANLTHYGLDTHLEIGVSITGKPVKHLRNLMLRLLSSKLVTQLD